MSIDDFTELLRAFSASVSRRAVIAGLATGILGIVPLSQSHEDALGKGRNRNQNKTRRKRKKHKRQEPGFSSPGPTTRPDASCPRPPDEVVGGNVTDGNVRVAQTFTTLDSGLLVRAELLVRKFPASVGDYFLHLGTVDNFGVPTNEVLAVASAANPTVPDGESIVPFAFVSPFSVLAGTRYALVLTRPSSDDLLWLGRFGDSCPGRSFLSTDQTAPFDGVAAGTDLIFTTFVSS
jgi:hypothetical protein